MSDRSVLGFCPDEARPSPDSVGSIDRDVTVTDVVMLASAALAVVFAVGLFALGF